MVYHFRKRLLQLEIFDLFRTIDCLNRQLTYFFHDLSNHLPKHIWNEIFKYHLNSFNNYKQKLTLTHKNKLDELLYKFNKDKLKKIKPINYYVNIDTSTQAEQTYSHSKIPTEQNEMALNLTHLLKSWKN